MGPSFFLTPLSFLKFVLTIFFASAIPLFGIFFIKLIVINEGAGSPGVGHLPSVQGRFFRRGVFIQLMLYPGSLGVSPPFFPRSPLPWPFFSFRIRGRIPSLRPFKLIFSSHLLPTFSLPLYPDCPTFKFVLVIFDWSSFANLISSSYHFFFFGD